MPRIDFTGVSDGFDPMPEGTYNAVFSKAEFVAQSKSSGEPYIQMEYTITDEEYSGRKAWRNRSLQKQSLWALKSDLKKIGVTDEQLEGEFDTDIMEDFYGAECRLKIGVKEFEGKERNEVQDVLAPEYAF